MARRLALTMVYLVLAWVLMVSYQIFTNTAVTNISSSLTKSSPAIASALNSSANVIVFICSFAWTFVLSAVISTLMFGKERRLSIQFLVSLGLTLTGSVLLGLLYGAGIDLASPNVFSSPFAVLSNNVVFAFFYLALPFLFMVAFDLRAIIKRKM